jgi:hypothetical protein
MWSLFFSCCDLIEPLPWNLLDANKNNVEYNTDDSNELKKPSRSKTKSKRVIVYFTTFVFSGSFPFSSQASLSVISDLDT